MSQAFSIRIDPELVRSAADNRFMPELAAFYLLKSHFINSRVYDIDNPFKRMAEVAGVSQQTIKKYIARLTFRGLIRRDGGAFVLAATPHGKYRARVQSDTRPGLQQLKQLLYAQILEQTGRQQAIKYALEEYLTSDGSESGNRGKQTRGDAFAVAMSVRNISKACNCSVGSARKLIGDLNRALVIRTTQPDQEFLFYAGAPALSHLEGYAGYRYHANGSLREIRPSQHEFLQHPIPYKPVDLVSYKRMMKDEKLRRFAYKLKLSNIQ